MKRLPDPSTATAVVFPSSWTGTVVCNPAKFTDCACSVRGAVRAAIDRAAPSRPLVFRAPSKLLQEDPAAIDLLFLRFFFISFLLMELGFRALKPLSTRSQQRTLAECLRSMRRVRCRVVSDWREALLTAST